MQIPHPYVIKDSHYYPWFGVSYIKINVVSSWKSLLLKYKLLHELVSFYRFHDFSFFSQKCIGAIDGTYVDVNMTRENKVPYWDYKSNTLQNVLYIVDFNLCFTYVYAGWEGSTLDFRIFWKCIYDLKVHFPTPIEGNTS
jgi:hypothetical protein